MNPTPIPAAESSAPLTILSPMALFERQCVQSGVDADARALRALLRSFFDAGMDAGNREATCPARRATNPDQFAHGHQDGAFAALGEIGFDPERVKAMLERTSASPNVDASLREAVRCLIVVRGRLSTEINYKGMVEAYDAAVRVHGK